MLAQPDSLSLSPPISSAGANAPAKNAEPLDMRAARVGKWPLAERQALRDWALAARAKSGGQRAEHAEAPAGLSRGEKAQKESKGGAARADELDSLALLEAAQGLAGADALWAAERALQARAMLAGAEFFQIFAQKSKEMGSDELFDSASLLAEVAQAAFSRVKLEEWAACEAGRAPPGVEEFGALRELLSPAELAAHVIGSVSWSASWSAVLDRSRLGRSRPEYSPAECARAMERAERWAFPAPLNELPPESIDRLIQAGKWAAASTLIQRGARASVRGRLSVIEQGAPEAATSRGWRWLGAEEFMSTLAKSEAKPPFFGLLLLAALQRESDDALAWLLSLAAPGASDAFRALGWFALTERYVLLGDTPAWRLEEDRAGSTTSYAVNEWIQRRLKTLDAWPLPAPEALAALLESATERSCVKTTQWLLARGAPAAGLGGQGLPLARAAQGDDWSLARQLAERGGWGPKGEEKVAQWEGDLLDNPRSERDFEARKWRSEARARLEARALSAEAFKENGLPSPQVAPARRI